MATGSSEWKFTQYLIIKVTHAPREVQGVLSKVMLLNEQKNGNESTSLDRKIEELHHKEVKRFLINFSP